MFDFSTILVVSENFNEPLFEKFCKILNIFKIHPHRVLYSRFDIVSFYLDFSRVLNMGRGSDRARNPLPQIIYDRNDRIENEKYLKDSSQMWDFKYTQKGQVFLADIKSLRTIMFECSGYRQTLEDLGISQLVFLSNRFLNKTSSDFIICLVI